MFSRPTERRPVHRIRLVCLVTVGLALFVPPSMQAESTGEASGRPPIRVELRGKLSDPNGMRGNAGRFTLSIGGGGLALSDHGSYVTRVGFVSVRTLYGARGTIRIALPQGTPMVWEIIKGTKAYARVRGRGTERWVQPPASAPRRMRVTMTGRVWKRSTG